MIIHDDFLFNLYIGGADDKLYPAEYLQLTQESSLENHPLFASLKSCMGSTRLVFLRQTHSDVGVVVTPEALAQLNPFAHEGDFLITDQKHVGLGVMTADCLPVALHDPVKQVVGIVHAGWRGVAHQIVVKAIKAMIDTYGTQAYDVRVLFGPSARACCYEVSPDFWQQFTHGQYEKKKYIQERAGKLFFDLPALVVVQLCALGVPLESINKNYNLCTIENENYFSHRRQQENAGRQMMVVSLK